MSPFAVDAPVRAAIAPVAVIRAARISAIPAARVRERVSSAPLSVRLSWCMTSQSACGSRTVRRAERPFDPGRDFAVTGGRWAAGPTARRTEALGARPIGVDRGWPDVTFPAPRKWPRSPARGTSGRACRRQPWLNVEDQPRAPTFEMRAPIRRCRIPRSEDMKYLLMIYNNPATYEAWSEDQRDELFSTVDVIMKELTESGELIGGQGLADASTAKTVRVRNGVPATTDGPFAEAKEQLGGYLIVECETEERAVEIAASWPDAKYFAIEVRAIMHTSGTEM